MNSRERVVLALKHQEPDRVPMNFGGIHNSIHHLGHQRLLELCGLPVYDAPISDRFQMCVVPSPQLQERFHNDVLSFYANPGSNWIFRLDLATDSWTDEWGVSYSRPKGGYWYDFLSHPIQGDTLQDVEAYPMPDPLDPARVSGLRNRVEEAYRTTDKALIMHCPIAGIHEHSYFLFGMEKLYYAMAVNIKVVEALARRIFEWQKAAWDQILAAVGDLIQVVQISDDLGGQDHLLFSPELYRRVYKPLHRQLCDHLRARTDAKIYFHSCGAIAELIPDMIEVGIQILNPAQVSAKGMDSARLKQEFGRDMCFWGGGADPRLLSSATPEQVRQEVRRRISDFAPGGGYVFGPVHNIQAEVPPENVVALYEAAYEFGQY